MAHPQKKSQKSSLLRPGPLGIEDEHLYKLTKDLSPEKRLELALELMETAWELRRAAGMIPSDKDLQQLLNWQKY